MRTSTLLCCIVFAVWTGTPASASALGKGDRAPAFAAPALDEGSEPLSLQAYRGKVVYVDFWATWCPPCLQALPRLEALRKELPSDVQFLAINLDRDLDAARAFVREHGIGYPSARDPEGRLPEAFGLETMPTSYVIDRKGVIRYVHAGFRPSDITEIRKKILAVVGEGR